MAKLTMNSPGGHSLRQAEFAPPKQDTKTFWIMVAAGSVFLMMFTGLVVLSTILIMQSGAGQGPSYASDMQLDEPSYATAQDVVTRREIDILQPADTAAGAAPESVAAVAPLAQKNPPSAAGIKVASAANAAVRLGPDHRYRVPSCVDYLDTLVKITTVRFATGSDKPLATDMIRARTIATAVAKCDAVKVIVEGHSDRKGGDKLNMDLSWFRAQSVIDQLQREGFQITALQPRGFGATRPINLSGTISGEAENRRVQFSLAPRAAPTATPASDR